MAGRRLLILFALVAIGGAACSGGGSQQSLPQQQSSNAVPMARATPPPTHAPPPPPADGHYLYALQGGASSAVYLYSLPLTPNSRSVYSIADPDPNYPFNNLFVSEKDILIGGYSDIFVFYRTGPYAFRSECHIGTYIVDGIAESSTSLYVAAQAGFAGYYLTKYDDGTAQDPCRVGFPPPFYDRNGMYTTDDIAADDSYVYLSNFFPGGSSLLAYPQPLTVNTVPSIIINNGAVRNNQIAVTKTDLYVAQQPYSSGPGALLDYSLPLSSSSSPVATITFPDCYARGVAVYPPDDDLGAKDHRFVPAAKSKTSEASELFVSCDNYVYTYALPLTNSSTPLVTTYGIAGIRLSAR
jgi:hypothetical protein